jgi:formylglycine-generating enzyme required for sulfatase activity
VEPAGEFVLVPEGDFMKGCPGSQSQQTAQLAAKFGYDPDSFQKAYEERKSSLPSFYIGKFAVTNEAYLKFVQETGRPQPKHWWKGQDRKPFPEAHKNLPVVNVTFNDASEFCRWLGKDYRLPTGDEWEKAARGTKGWLYPWGNTFDKSRCNGAEADVDVPAPVDSYKDGVSPFGAYNMVGNVGEWVDDVKHLRGGSFKTPCELYGLTFYILESPAGRTDMDIGFRCAMDADR